MAAEYASSRHCDPLVVEGPRPPLLSFSGYRWWLLADTSASVAVSLRDFAIPVVLLVATGSASRASFAAAALLVGAAVAQIPGGAIQDRFDHRHIAIWWSLLGVVLFGAFFFLVKFNALSLWSATFLAALLGIRSGLGGGVFGIMLRRIVPGDRLGRALAVNDGRDAVLEFVGPPLAGALLKLAASLPFVAGSVLSLLSLVGSIRLPKRDRSGMDGQGEAAEGGVNPSSIGDSIGAGAPSGVLAGMKWVLGNRFSRTLTFAGTPILTLFNALILTTVFDLVKRGASPAAAGVVNSAVAIGVFVGSLLVVPLMTRVRGGLLCYAAFALPVLTGISLLWAPNLAVKLAAIVPALVFLPVGNAVAGSLQMQVIPERYLGRVFAAIGLFEALVGAVVVRISGIALDRLGYRFTVALLASAMTVLFLVVLASKEVRRIPKEDRQAYYATTLA